MVKILLLIVAAFYGITSLVMWFAPLYWYETTPGVTTTGPFNLHFDRDIALVFLMASSAIAWGAWRDVRLAAIVGAAWPCMHGLFHIQIWMARGLPIDEVAISNLFAIQLPAWTALYLATKLSSPPSSSKE